MFCTKPNYLGLIGYVSVRKVVVYNWNQWRFWIGKDGGFQPESLTVFTGIRSNILSLQKMLGHQSLTMTMRYAHLSPEHLEEARVLSPYAKFLT
jgi:hypothetical protein